MKQQGFHLIELLIVLSIVGILLAYALPNYNAHLTHTRRLIAETALMKLASYMEAYFAKYNTYEGANMARFKIPEFIANNHYQLVIQAATVSQFTLAAIPQENQAPYDTRCGSLWLNSQGEKGMSGNGVLSECW